MVCRMDLEGIVAKRRDGLYSPHRTSWIKIKNRAYSQAERRGQAFEAGAIGGSVDRWRLPLRHGSSDPERDDGRRTIAARARNFISLAEVQESRSSSGAH